ncbi:MAG TPA: glycosyltransferase 87 family protein [Streptosporangiaceae bacterium]|nr:glycosyltransferase 87 family protein [Streptosporangiaceae bacterium]
MALAERTVTGQQPAGPAGPAARKRRNRVLMLGGLLALAAAFGLYVATIVTHPLGLMLAGFDLRVYRGAGLVALHDASSLYSWQLVPGARFTYTPFAALLFAVATVFPWPAAMWLMAVSSLLALLATVWMTAGQLGWYGRRRLGLACAVTAAALWTEPVQRTLHVGQVELLLMALVVWDLGRPGGRRWQGAGIGLAAGVKLVPLIFIPYLLLTRRFRQAAVASAVFAGTVAIGWAALPQASAQWWLGPDFLAADRTGFIGFQANQSLRGLLTRLAGGVNAATPGWLALAAATAVAGLLAAALLHSAGRPVQGWVTCALTGLLVSPISWDHHWVWIAPALALLADTAVRARGVLRWAEWVFSGVLALAFGGWPAIWNRGAALVPWGLIWYPPGTTSGLSASGRHPEYSWQGADLIAGNLYVLAGLVLFAGLLIAAARCRRSQRSTRARAATKPAKQRSLRPGLPRCGRRHDRADGQTAGAADLSAGQPEHGQPEHGPARRPARRGGAAGDPGRRAAAHRDHAHPW